ncbi:hypothetical protein [Geodermatophilus ruber]|uniref:ABC transport system ATP-binding protein n=1 Tax=Geodermatophilus ruber TaxID=504800 RepID=A0A1I4C4A2_9ACTN|nr:hypothetical protein [Geodermatophilus ruber]SFK75016.1 hypothetical protein SAMN04488085_103303 [Geodermatophilus ruber]
MFAATPASVGTRCVHDGGAAGSSGSGDRPPRPTAGALIADLRAALAGRLVVCVTHDDLEQPGDTVVRLDREAARLAG